MSVKPEPSGRRTLTTEFEVAGTPEEVWHAIATGPGISSWFVPAEVEERDGKPVAVHYHFGPGGGFSARVTASEAPRLFAGEADGWLPGSPAMATEWHIEARDGGTCILRIVHSLFASTDEWDSQLEGAASGWSGFLNTLLLYLRHFRGQPGTVEQLRAPAPATDAESWDALTAALGLQGMRVGQRFAAPAGTPALSGVVEYVTEDPFDALLRIEQPAAGLVAMGIAGSPGSETSTVAMNLYLYGEEGAAALAREVPRWKAWFDERFAANTSRP